MTYFEPFDSQPMWSKLHSICYEIHSFYKRFLGLIWQHVINDHAAIMNWVGKEVLILLCGSGLPSTTLTQIKYYSIHWVFKQQVLAHPLTHFGLMSHVHILKNNSHFHNEAYIYMYIYIYICSYMHANSSICLCPHGANHYLNQWWLNCLIHTCIIWPG